LPRKSRNEEEDEMKEDDDREKDVADDEDDDDDEDTIGLDEAEEEEEDDDDDDEDEEEKGASADDLERRRLFQGEAEEVLENLTLEEVKEVLAENELDLGLASKLKKILGQVVAEGKLASMDDAWDEALERLQE
jgi:hypothetical protein